MQKTSFVTSIGNTPLTRLDRISALVGANVFIKQERSNPAGSVKDRIALYMVQDAIERGILKPGSSDVTIIEPTSGNTGIGLAAIGAALNIPVALVMPDTMSVERRNLMAIYGAKLVLTPGAQGMKGAIQEANRILESDPDHYFMPMQFDNQANAKAHFETTGPEIAKQLGANVDIILAGVGTGGTITGSARFLKPASPDLKVYAVEPSTSPVIHQALHNETIKPGPHGIQGIGAGFIPKVLDLSLLTDAIGIDTETAIQTGRDLIRQDAISTGISGGANVAAVLELSRRGLIQPGMNIVTFIPDGVEKYLSTKLAQ